MTYPNIPPGVDVEALLLGEQELLEKLEAIRKIKSFLGLVTTDAPRKPVANHRRPKTKRAHKGTTWLDDLVSILRENGSAMHWSALYENIKLMRPNVDAKQPAATIRSYVRRAAERGDTRIVPVGNGKFGLSEWEPEIKLSTAGENGEADK